MSSMEHTDEIACRNHRCGKDENQLMLPIEIREPREVQWIHGVQEEKKRLFGKKVVTRLLIDEDKYIPHTTSIDSGAINELSDPALRYALRFADAARAVGWTRQAPGVNSRHDVRVIATDDDLDSQLISATYSGVGKSTADTFLQNLYSAEPKRE